MSGEIRDEELIRAYLVGRDVACPECSYNLRDLREARCPECGCTLAIKGEILRVRGRPSRPPRKPGDWMHRVGTSGLVVAALISASIVWGQMDSYDARAGTLDDGFWGDPSWAGAMISLCVHLSVVVIFVNLKPQFQRRSRVFQRVVMLLCWYWLPILLTLFMALIV